MSVTVPGHELSVSSAWAKNHLTLCAAPLCRVRAATTKDITL